MKRAILYVVLLSLLLGIALAEEPFCPGGSDPDPAVVWCASFDNLDNCVTGTEAQCWSDNGFSGQPPFYGDGDGKLQIHPGPGAVGPGLVRGVANPGIKGSGYTKEYLPGGPYPSVNLRWYALYNGSYMNSYGGGGHGPGISTRENSQFTYYFYSSGTAVGSFNLKPNLATPVLRNGRWYLIEMQYVLDTACTDVSDVHGCNGIARMWIDDELVLEYTDINWGGTVGKEGFASVWGPREYYNARIPFFFTTPDIRHQMIYDNFVVRTDGQRIGPALDENPRGEPDMVSPYLNMVGIEPFQGPDAAQSCSGSGYLGTQAGQRYRDGATLEESLATGKYVEQCAETSDKALVANASPGGGAGMYWEPMKDGRSSVIDQVVVHGEIYLPSSNDYSVPSSLFGIISYGCSADADCSEVQFGNQVAVTVDAGRWAVQQRYRTFPPEISVATDVPVALDRWVPFEVIFWDDDFVTLMVDGVRILDRAPLARSSDYFWRETASAPKIVVGVIDNDGASPLTVYYDNIRIGSASYWSCDGWGVSCPFTDGDGYTPPPSDGTPPPPSSPTPGPSPSSGDVNGDGLVNVLDLVYLSHRLGQSDPLLDLSGNGRVDVFDLVAVVRSLSVLDRCPAPGKGLFTACYYNDTAFSEFVFSRTEDSVSLTDTPDYERMGYSTFSAVWEGFFDFPAGEYRFTATSDDGIRVYVDGALLIDEWYDHSGVHNATVSLGPGSHRVRVAYYQNSGNLRAVVDWEPV